MCGGTINSRLDYLISELPGAGVTTNDWFTSRSSAPWFCVVVRSCDAPCVRQSSDCGRAVVWLPPSGAVDPLDYLMCFTQPTYTKCCGLAKYVSCTCSSGLALPYLYFVSCFCRTPVVRLPGDLWVVTLAWRTPFFGLGVCRIRTKHLLLELKCLHL